MAEFIETEDYLNWVKLLDVPVIKQKKNEITIFIDYCKRNKKYKIGVLKKDIDGLVPYKKGDTVLFSLRNPQDLYCKCLTEDAMRAVRKVTIEIPARLLFPDTTYATVKCVVGVPIEYIDYEITF